MTACIDFGNTTAKIAFFDQAGKIRNTEKFDSIIALVEVLKAHNPKLLGIVACSVTRSAEELDHIFSPLQIPFFILQSNAILSIKNAYGTPETLGPDRLAAAVGANCLFPNQNVLVIDMGTAIKYDYVSADGTFQGGIISAGMRIRFEALHTFTKKLPLVNATDIPPLIGKSTHACIQSGVVNGIAAELNGIIKKYKQLGECQVILTGGDAPFFESTVEYPYFAEPNVVFIGLYAAYHYQLSINNQRSAE